jgi:phosphodiesterase/alkaline phosphatase D-like protein
MAGLHNEAQAGARPPERRAVVRFRRPAASSISLTPMLVTFLLAPLALLTSTKPNLLPRPLEAQEPAPRAAVLEFADRWTGGATGLGWLLQEAGFRVEPLTADSLRHVALAAFGSFTNNAPDYQAFVRDHGEALRAFVARGGVVLDLAQSDQFGARVVYLPEGCDVRRCDADDASVRVESEAHPLAVAGWLRGTEPLATLDGHEASWEGIERWTGAQRLLSAGKAGAGRAALVEVAHGRGRFLVSSLWLDKLLRNDALVAPEAQRTAALQFGAALLQYVRAVRDGAAPAVLPQPAPVELPVGPMVGHVDRTTAHIWMRPAAEGAYTLLVSGAGTKIHVTAQATAANDRCVTWRVEGLTAETSYSYEVHRGEDLIAGGPSGRFETAPDGPARVVLAFGSCASSEPSSVWSAMELSGAEGLVLLGDTPYIDTCDLEVAREKHRRFLEVPELARLVRGLPVWATWDDHDFGANDSDGRLEGKEHTRRAFVEHRALASYGDGENGVYTSFRRGPVEVFLLDPRWFARTETDTEGRPSLLGAAQWRWLEEGLVTSTAPFKVIACGMIWDDKGNSESDDWGSYPYERERLERFLGDRRITGVVLVGGDIHVSRHLRYPDTVARVGYVLDQLIVSPLHDRVIASLDVPHPALLWSAREPRVYLLLEADSRREDPVLVARWLQDIGRGAGRELRRVEWRASELAPRR